MLAVGHPTVAVLLGLGAAGLGALVVAMAWNIHVRQFRLAELLARRQFTGTADARPAGYAANGNGDAEAGPQEAAGTGGPTGSGGKENTSRGRTRWSPASKRVTGQSCPGAAPWCRGRSAAARCRSPLTRITPTSYC